MRYARPIPGLLSIIALLVACSTPGASAQGSLPPAASPLPTATPSPTASPSAAAGQSVPNSADGSAGASGSVTYHISGGYIAAGKLVFVAAASSQADAPVFDGTGWTATFANAKGGIVLLDTRPASLSHPNSPSVEFTDGTVIVPATEAFGCTFTFAKNDASRLAGKVDCPATHVAYTAGGAPGIVTFSAQWDARS
jgi:hypothetical protein